jgi:hypothetical protein
MQLTNTASDIGSPSLKEDIFTPLLCPLQLKKTSKVARQTDYGMRGMEARLLQSNANFGAARTTDT